MAVITRAVSNTHFS